MNAEAKLVFPTETADTVLNALPHPIVMVSPDGKIAEANAAAESFFEVSIPLLRQIMAKAGRRILAVTSCRTRRRSRCPCQATIPFR